MLHHLKLIRDYFGCGFFNLNQYHTGYLNALINPQVLVTAAIVVVSNVYFKLLASIQSVLSGNQVLLTKSIFCKPFSLQFPKYIFFHTGTRS